MSHDTSKSNHIYSAVVASFPPFFFFFLLTFLTPLTYRRYNSF
jgi:hypothetical protein